MNPMSELLSDEYFEPLELRRGEDGRVPVADHDGIGADQAAVDLRHLCHSLSHMMLLCSRGV
jgi:hypothetical protein